MKTPAFLKALQEKHPFLYDLGTDVVLSLAIVAVIASALYLYSGTWPPIVSVVGDSMYPNMYDGDLVFLQGLSRGEVMTCEAANDTGYMKYGKPGDVIIYRPMGRTDVKPVIHRAMYWVNESEPMWPGGQLAPAAGYITLGDNNDGQLDQKTNICLLQPVRKEWIIGIARHNVPFLGHIRSMMPF